MDVGVAVSFAEADVIGHVLRAETPDVIAYLSVFREFFYQALTLSVH